MDFDSTAAVTAVIGVIVGAAAVLVLRRSPHQPTEARPAEVDIDRAPTVDIPAVSEGLSRVLSVLPGAAIVVGPDSAVLRASPPATSLGLVRGDRIMVPQINVMVTKVRRDGKIREEEFDLLRPPLGNGGLRMRVRVAPLTSNTSLVLAEDVSEAMRVDAVRRDFVANVSHELKTPVGALSLLSEAVQAASDDPESVRHFAGRMQIESQRLTNMINDLIDLSRLQGADTPKKASLIDSTRVIAESCDATRLAAQAREIEVVVGTAVDAQVYGDEAQLVMALRNLLTNAIAYSPPRTRVAVATRIVPDSAGDIVEISVTDQGIGIPYGEQDRIFERFYRVDPARSRITGGTGLGLAIVKHVCVNHGGECTVWSVEGEGSTFTLRLPTTAATAIPPALDPSATPRVLRNPGTPPTVATATAREERVP